MSGMEDEAEKEFHSIKHQQAAPHHPRASRYNQYQISKTHVVEGPETKTKIIENPSEKIVTENFPNLGTGWWIPKYKRHL